MNKEIRALVRAITAEGHKSNRLVNRVSGFPLLNPVPKHTYSVFSKREKTHLLSLKEERLTSRKAHTQSNL